MQGQLEDAEGRLQALHDSHTSLIQEQEVSGQQRGSCMAFHTAQTLTPSGLQLRHEEYVDRHPCMAFAAHGPQRCPRTQLELELGMCCPVVGRCLQASLACLCFESFESPLSTMS